MIPRRKHRVPQGRHRYTRWWAFCLGSGCLEDQIQQCPSCFTLFVPEEQFRRAAPTGDLSTEERWITSLINRMDNQDRRRTSLQLAEFLRERRANFDAVAEPNREVSLEEESKSVLQTSAQSNAEVDGSADCTSSSRIRTSFQEPKQRSKKHVTLKEVIRRRANQTLTRSEAVPVEQVEPVFQTSASVQTRNEVCNNIQQKFLCRFSDKSDDLPWFMTNESAIKQIRQRAEILNYHPECIQEKTSSPFFQVFNKEERGRAKKRFQNFLRRHSETGSPWSEPLQNSSEGQIPMKNVSPATKVHNIESVPSGLPPEEKSDHVLMGKKSTQRFSPIKKVTKTKTDSGLSEKNNVNVVLVEEPLPSTSKGKTHYTKTTQREEKTNRDSEYTSAFSRPHFDNPEEEEWAQMVSAQYSFLNQYLRERKKEKMRKGFESTESDTSDEEPVHSTSGGRTHSANMFLKPELRNEYEREYPPSEHRFAKMSEEQWALMCASLYSFIGKLLRKDFKKMIKKMFENPESTICSNEVPIPDEPKVRTHLEQKMTDRKDAQVHSRLPSVKRKEHIKEQADCCCTRWKEFLRNDIKETLREELAVENAKMRKLFRKEAEEIMGLLRNELKQICMELVALQKEQAKKIQQEHRNLQYLWLNDLFRKDVKEVVYEEIKKSKMVIGPKEEPRLGPSKGTTDFQRTAPECKKEKKYKGAHESAPSHSGKPLVETDEESVDGQNESHCMPLKDLIKDDLKENFREVLEKYKYDSCMKKKLPHIFKGRKQLREISTEQKLKKKYDSKSLYSEQPATKTVKKVEHDALQYVHLMEVIKKDLKVRTHEVLGKYKTNVCPKEEDLPPVSKKKTRTKVEEEEFSSTIHFNSFKHRIAALRATAHVEPPPAAYARYAVGSGIGQHSQGSTDSPT